MSKIVWMQNMNSYDLQSIKSDFESMTTFKYNNVRSECKMKHIILIQVISGVNTDEIS